VAQQNQQTRRIRESQHQRSQSQPQLTENNPTVTISQRSRYRFYQRASPQLNITLPTSPPLPPQVRAGNISPVTSTFSQTRTSLPSTASSPTSPVRQQIQLSRDFVTSQGIYRSDEETNYRPLVGSSRNNRRSDSPEERLIIDTNSNQGDNNQFDYHTNQQIDYQQDAYTEFEQFLNQTPDLIDLNNEPDNSDSSDSGDTVPDDNIEVENEPEEMTTLLAKPQKFSGKPDEDPTEWLEDFLLAASANG
jgi:hypothetical protein